MKTLLRYALTFVLNPDKRVELVTAVVKATMDDFDKRAQDAMDTATEMVLRSKRYVEARRRLPVLPE